MKIAPNLDMMTLFILFVVPGLISMHIYRLIFPAGDIDWKNATIQALFYSSINLGLCLPILIFIHRGDFLNNHPVYYGIALFAMIFILPILWPLIFVWIIKNRKLSEKLQLLHPIPTAWDYLFEKRKPFIVLVQLKNGKKIGGYYGPNSFATSFPRQGDIYLESVAQVNDDGKFQGWVKNSAGVMIRKEDYDIIEFFNPPQ